MNRDFFHILQILFSLTLCVMFPFWVQDGYLSDPYPFFGAALGCYGGFIAGLLWYIDFLRNK